MWRRRSDGVVVHGEGISEDGKVMVQSATLEKRDREKIK